MRRSGRLVMYLGVAACVAALSKAHALEHHYSWSGSARFAWSLGFISLLGLSAYSVGLPDRSRRWRDAWIAAITASAIAAVAISAFQLVVGDALLPRFVVIGAAVILVPWFVLSAALTSDADSRAGLRDRVIVIAGSNELETLEDDLERAPERPALVVSWLTPVEANSLTDPPARPLVEVAHAERASVVVLSRAAQADDDIVLQASLLHGEGIRIRTLSLFYEQWLGKLPIGELERVSLLFDIGELHTTGYARVKRLFDVALALLGGLGLVLLVPFVAVGDLIGNRGPLLFRQARVGRNGTLFEMLKFRTMRDRRPDDDQDDGSWTSEDDDRVTSFGRFLRRTHLDELPQVVNILRGDISVVGPRPEQPHVVTELSGKLPFYGLRHLVRPGLTGWAQVKYQYAGSEAETLQKLQYEFFYLRRQSLGLDLQIVGRTLREVAGGRGR